MPTLRPKVLLLIAYESDNHGRTKLPSELLRDPEATVGAIVPHQVVSGLRVNPEAA